MYRVSYWERLSSGSSSVIVGFSVSVFTSFFKRTFGCWVLLLRGLVSGCEGRGSLSSCAAWALCCGARALAGKAVAAHSSGLACRITGTGEPGGPPSARAHRVGHDRGLSSGSGALGARALVAVAHELSCSAARGVFLAQGPDRCLLQQSH